MNCIIALMLIAVFGLAHSAMVTYYIHPEFQGQSDTVNLLGGVCHSLKAPFDKQLSSMNTWNSCVTLYRKSDCSGISFSLYPTTPCHDRFLDCDMEDIISSMKLCE